MSQSTSPPAETAGPTDHPPAGVGSLWRLRGYLRPHLRSLVIMASTALAGVGLTIAIPLVTKAIIDGPITDHEIGPVLPLGVLALCLGILEAVLIFGRRWVQSTAVLAMETTMRGDLYARLQELPMAFHGQWQSGQLLSRVTNDLSSIRRFFGFGLLFLVMNILQLVVVTLVLLRMYWPLGLVVAAASIPIIALSNRFERSYVLISRRVQDEQGDLATLAEEGAVGIRVIKSFGRGRFVAGRYDDAARTLYDTSMDKVRLSAKFWTFLEVIPNFAVVVVLLLGALGVGHGDLTLGTLVAFITLMLSLVWPIASLGYILAMAQEAMTSAARILEIFDTEPSITSGATVLEQPRGHLRLEGVGFAFPDLPDELVLRDVHLEVVPGETVAIVGATGSGKTVLTSLVPRLYDVTAGRVTIDGVDVRDLDLASLRQVVATAFEEPTLFSMSARENLLLGRRDATEEEMHEAVEVAQAGVRPRPARGAWTPGSASRACRCPAASGSGSRWPGRCSRGRGSWSSTTRCPRSTCTPRRWSRRRCGGCSRDATGIVVAHRASTVLLADKVALLQDGTITHVGRHSDLLATVPAYRELLAADADADLEEASA